MFITQVFILHTFFVPGTEVASATKTEVPPFMQIDEDCDLRHLVRKGISENVIFEKNVKEMREYFHGDTERKSSMQSKQSVQKPWGSWISLCLRSLAWGEEGKEQ